MDNLQLASLSYIWIVILLHVIAAVFFFCMRTVNNPNLDAASKFFSYFFLSLSVGYVFILTNLPLPAPITHMVGYSAIITSVFFLRWGFGRRKGENDIVQKERKLLYLNLLIILLVYVVLLTMLYDSFELRVVAVVSNFVIILISSFPLIKLRVDENSHFGEKATFVSIGVIICIFTGLPIVTILTGDQFLFQSLAMISRSTVAVLALGALLSLLYCDLLQLYEDNTIADPMTGTANRRYFISQSERILNSSHRHHRPVSVMICNIDNLKDINKEYGRNVGDQLITAFGDTLKDSLRAGDLIARFGGKEFIVLLTETSASNAAQLADRMRLHTQKVKVKTSSRELGFTASFGVTQWDEQSSLDELITAAENALKSAKDKGKNRVRLIHSI